jgi:hypothetical protein
MLFYNYIPETLKDRGITLVLSVSLDMRWKIEGLNCNLNTFLNVCKNKGIDISDIHDKNINSIDILARINEKCSDDHDTAKMLAKMLHNLSDENYIYVEPQYVIYSIDI